MSLPTTSNVARPRGLGYGVRIDTGYFRLAVTPELPIELVTAPLQAPTINTVESAEDIRNDFGQIFSRADFTGGEGLDFAHRRNASDLDPTRFWDSKHIDITNPQPGHPSKLRLLPATTLIEGSADSNLHLAYDGSAVVMTEGTAGNTRRSTNWTAGTPTFSDEASGAATTLSDLTTLGADIYAASGTGGIEKRTGGSWAGFSATHTVRVWGLKRQLLAATGSDGRSLDAVSGAGTHTVLVALAAGQEWLDAADCGQAILACGSDGAIYALGFNSSGAAGGTLELKAQTPMGGTEIPYAVGFDGTFVYYATREATPSGAIGRWYRAELSDAFTLTGGLLLRQWGDQSATIDHCPRRIIATRDAVFTGVYEDNGSFVWRYDRATSGVSRHLDLVADGLVVDLLAVSGRLFATVAAHGLRREAVGTFETSGYLIGPLADFFSASMKSWAGALLEHDEIESDSRIELYFTTDKTALEDPESTSWQRAKNVTSGVDADETSLTNIEGRYLAAMIKLYTDGEGTTTPQVSSYSFRAYPGEGDVEVTFHVVAADVIERPGYRRQRVPGLGDLVYEVLKGREGSFAEIELLRLGETLRGVVLQVGARTPALVEKGSTVDVVGVKFRGRRVTAIDTSSTSTGSIGVGQMGVMFMGGLEEAA